MVKKYKRSDKLQLSKNFRLDEFKCKCGKCDPILVDDALVTWLQKIRDHFGKSVNINSGYRCAAHNVNVKGANGSHHVKGMAADIRVEGVEPKEVAKYAESIGIKRIGLYEGAEGNFVHIGSADTKKFWLGHIGKVVDTFGGAKVQTCTVELPVLREGMKCDAVEAVQAMLVGLGYDLGKTGERKNGIDGSFGSKTENALESYQEDKDLEADGVCGPITWKSFFGV